MHERFIKSDNYQRKDVNKPVAKPQTDSILEGTDPHGSGARQLPAWRVGFLQP